MIKSIDLLEAGPDFITIAWNKPKYTPDYYRTLTKCRTWYSPLWYRTIRLNISSDMYTMNLTNLNPGSRCIIRFVAVFNPANLDPGIDIRFATFLSRKFFSHACMYVHTSLRTWLHQIPSGAPNIQNVYTKLLP